MKRVALLGATGSIGASALDVIGRHPDRLKLTVATAHTDVSGLAKVCRDYGSQHAVIADPDRLPALRDALASASPTTVAHGGPAALAEWAASPVVDSVVAGIVGTAGLPSVLAAAKAGKTLLLANKESLVMAGALLLDAARRGGASIVPLDSEHNALYQCMAGGREGVTGVDLTASGGPFLGRDRAALARVTVEQACAHPIWKMGRKISVDSATLMNKGLEVIEAHLLFSIPANDIGVVIHPQSLVHALVHYRDGSTLAHLGQPDMRVAIAHALGLPERIDSGVGRLDLVAAGRLDFQAPDLESFRCLGLAFTALAAGYDAPLVLNAANEVAVEAFLQGELGFLGIDAVIADCLDRCVGSSLPTDFEELNARDAAVRRYAHRRISSHHKVAA